MPKMPEKPSSPWERELENQVMNRELYIAGKRAGAHTAAAEWPHVERLRASVVDMGRQATAELFGRGGIPLNRDYCAGWTDGYVTRCGELDQT